jgi:UDP-N-acetylmuramoyl-tripeptide--D-alanyl-D-alanine ligase
VHTEGVGGIEGVAREKGALLAGLRASATAVWNVEETPLAPYAERSAATRKITYGRVDGADVRLIRWELDGHGGTHASYAIRGRDALLDVRLAMLGESAAINAAGALAVVLAIDETRLEAAASALAGVSPKAHRMVPVELASGLLVIDDAYNASPRATIAALETAALLAAQRGGALIAVLGDMLELGGEAERLHADVGREAIRAGARALIACGELMAHAGRAALAAAGERRGERAKIVLLKRPEDAVACVRELARERDVVLVKGSRGMQMERVVDALRAEEGA